VEKQTENQLASVAAHDRTRTSGGLQATPLGARGGDVHTRHASADARGSPIQAGHL
jgi:hypothetical protein